MKRITILSLAVVLAGCQRVQEVFPAQVPAEQSGMDEKEALDSKTLRCTKDKDVQELSGTGDVLESLRQTFFISSDSLAGAEKAEDQELTDAVNEMLQNTYGNLEGVSASGEIKDKHANVTVDIDFTKADTDQLVEKGLMTEGEAGSDHVSMRQVRKDLEAQGFVCE